MAGHSKWANIQHRKGVQDAKRGKIFTRCIREITTAARNGDPDPANNPRLRLAIDKALTANMTRDTIERAVKRGAGGDDSAAIEEIRYEGYGPGGVAILVDVMTDNRNRTGDEILLIFSKNGGNRGAAGCVSYMFKSKALVRVKREGVDEDALIGDALDAGAEDVVTDDSDVFEIYGAVADLDKIKDALVSKKYPIESAEPTKKPDVLVALDENNAGKVLKMIEQFEDHDDVQKVWANFDIPDQVLAKLG